MTPGELAAIIVRLDKQDEVLGEIKSHVAETNGKVASLMADKIARDAIAQDRAEREQTASKRREWRPSAAVAVLCVVLGVLLERVL